MDVTIQLIDEILQEMTRLGQDLDRQSLDRRQQAEQVVQEMHRSLHKLLVDGLDSDKVEVRRSAVYGLGKIGREGDLPLLLESLNDPDEAVRAWAVEALGSLRNPTCINELVQRLADSDSFVYYSTVMALRKFPPDAVVGPLISALFAENVVLRQRAAKLLGTMHAVPKAQEALMSAFYDEEPGVRYEVVEALSRIGDSRAIGVFIAALQDENHEVRAASIRGLKRLADPRAVGPLVALALSDQDARRQALEALRDICGAEALLPVYEALAEQEIRARQVAESVLNLRSYFGRALNLWEWEMGGVRN